MLMFEGTSCPWGDLIRLTRSIEMDYEKVLRRARQHCQDRIQSGEIGAKEIAEIEAVLELLK